MGLQINTNVSALNTYRNLSANQASLSKSLEKLSSGLRINRASDDAAGLVISEGLKAQIGGLTVAARNAQDGTSVVQTAEGALAESHSILQRLRDLAVQAANGTNDTNARAAIGAEATSLTDELTRISTSTKFNGTALLTGGSMTFQVGSNSGETISVNLANVSSVASALTSVSGANFTIATPSTVAGNFVFTTTGAAATTATVAMGTAGAYTTVGGVADKLNSDTGFAANFNASVDSGTGKLVVTAKNGGTVAATAPGTGAATGSTFTGAIDFSSASGASAAIATIDTQIAAISTARASLGAVSNRFDHAIANINVAIENLSASKSRITDTDMAQEMVSYTRGQILAQAGVSMLAQANQQPQLALKLLG
ncbi:flagellin N-terminal helical domain-containing protein [Naasia lichenicola]|uniref:Flagellin n=1 Tax=Naasia lichenicola TaxID=2565933 RepID=A0A4S4FIH4_9MICO|nr:flagellin [Naasia lichenicola]THG29664.1 flagellin [Naasia lichenicola]